MTAFDPNNGFVAGKAVESVPDLADGVTVAGGAGAWADTASYVQLDDGSGMPSNDFRLAAIALDTPSAAHLGQLTIAYGAALSETDIVKIPYEIATDAGALIPIPSGGGGVIPGGSRMAALLGTKAGGAQTVGVKLIVSEV